MVFDEFFECPQGGHALPRINEDREKKPARIRFGKGEDFLRRIFCRKRDDSLLDTDLIHDGDQFLGGECFEEILAALEVTLSGSQRVIRSAFARRTYTH